MSEYAAFLEAKTQFSGQSGFPPLRLHEFLFDFQRALVDWALRQGRGAIFADCGLGKTPMQLEWAENIVRKENGRVLILTPLAVSAQTIREAEKFGIEATRSPDGRIGGPGVYVTNYERLDKFNGTDFVGVVCDESSILKNFNGIRRGQITAFMRQMRYRLLCTATAAPNDYIELGTSSEALGFLGFMDMLGRFFKNDQNTSDTARKWAAHGGAPPKWRFKGHARGAFWRWVCSWAVAIRRPSDIGFEDERFILPPLIEREHIIEPRRIADGMLFSLPAVGLKEQREEQRRTIAERCEKTAELVAHDDAALVWCQLNDEGDLLESLIPDAVQVSGNDSDAAKEEKMCAFADGKVRVLITKPKIGAWGLNFQHCAHVTFFASHSFEQYYQAVRRCWRFGQTRPVTVDIVTTEGGSGVMANLQRKAQAADQMFSELVAHMNDAVRIDRNVTFPLAEQVPPWLC